MTFPAESTTTSRTRLLRVCAATWLLLISAAVIVNHVALSRLLDETRSNSQSAEFAALSGLVTELVQQMDAIERRPAPVTQASFTSARQALEERLSRLELSAADHAAASEMASLRSRLDEIEARAARPQPPTPPAAPARRAPPAEAARPRIVEPPFRLLGVELRGGERFLSIAPADTRSLAQARVLRPGETEGGWRLDALDGRTAVFSFEGQVRQLAVP